MIHRFTSEPGDGPVEASGLMGFRSDVERDYPLVQQHDDSSADLNMASRVAGEAARAGGAQVEVFLKTDNADFDQVWDEDADPTYWPGVLLKAIFAPKPLEIALKQWGTDATIRLEAWFAMADVRREFGDRVLRPGDIIRIPFNAVGNVTPKDFRVLNPTPDGNYRYNWLYFKVNLENLTGDITVQPPAPDTPSGSAGMRLGDLMHE